MPVIKESSLVQAPNRPTLLIGGGGLVGSQIAHRLIDQGRKVTVLGRQQQPRHLLPPSVTYVAGDFSDIAVMAPLLDSHTDVIHLAYATVPNTSYDNPLGDLLGNLPPSVQLFAEAAKRRLRLVLVSSGGTVYGEAIATPITEDHPTHPISPYGVTKLTVEKYAQLYSVTQGLDVVCVRPANAYGERQLPFTGQGFVATAVASALRGMPIQIYGEHGTIRDYIHIDDLAEGVISALNYGLCRGTYNIGTGIGYTNLQIVNSIATIVSEWGLHVSVEHRPARPFDVNINTLDSSRLSQLQGWRPEIAFQDGLLRTVKWMRSKVQI